MPPITFTDDDFHGLDHQQDDPMVITIEIENYAVKKVLVNQGNSVGILYWVTYQEIQLPDIATVPYENMFPPAATLTFTPNFVTEPKLKPFPSASSSLTHPHPIMSSLVVPRSIPSAPSSPPLTGHEIPFPFLRHSHRPLRPTPGTRILHGQPTPTTPNPANQPHRATTWLRDRSIG